MKRFIKAGILSLTLVSSVGTVVSCGSKPATASAVTTPVQVANSANEAEIKQLEYYIGKNLELSLLLKDRFRELGRKLDQSKEAWAWIKSLDPFIMDPKVAVRQISALRIVYNLKLFLLQNYLDKLSYRLMAAQAKNDQ